MERESSSSDEEEDRRNLIDPEETKTQRFTFEIGQIRELRSRIGRNFWFNKKYLVAICLPLFLAFIYFSFDLGSVFHSVSTSNVDSLSKHMEESELQALYLLRNQRLELLHLWNRTLVYPRSNSNPNSTTPNANSSSGSNSTIARDEKSLLLPALIEDFRSALFNQIKLNREIQQSLLSSHRVGNVSESVDDISDPAFGTYGINTCRKVDPMEARRTIEWKPKANKYLLMICLSGQMSNHLMCMQKHMFFAALLNRILVLPSSKVDYDYEQVIDIDHINKCFGRKVVITFEEFAEMKKHHLRVDRFICYVAKPPCFLDGEQVKRLEGIGFSFGKRVPAWPEDGKPDEPVKRVVDDILPKFSCDDEVLAIGDVFFARVEEDWVMQPGGPLAHKCKTVIQPSRLIVLSAQRFVQTFMGRDFIALHFRRHGFLKFCNMKKESCFYPIPQAAECILRVVERANAPIIYLSTDAAESETDLLQSLTVLNGKTVPLFKRPSHSRSEKWDALLYRHKIGGHSQVEAMLDKTICAMSTVFIGASGSTFTEDIIRLRKDWGSASICDEYLCQGEHPNFIAEIE